MSKLSHLAAVMLTLLMSTELARAQSVYIVGDSSIDQAAYASQRLAASLEARGYTVITKPEAYEHLISVAVNGFELSPEAFSITIEGPHISIYGGDTRGMVYGALAVVADLDRGLRLESIQARTESPDLQFRAIKHNFPWDSYRPSAALDQHIETTRDLAYWEAFLDMMAENRFNALTLWNLHPWPYLVKPRNFPEANPFSNEEHEQWRVLHQGIFRMAKERGIDTYLVPWNIFVSKAFVAAHDVGQLNTYPYYNSKGDTSELIKRYVRESVAQVLTEYPDLTGIGLSHSEAMGGMTAPQRAKWIAETYLQAIKSVDRPVKIIQKLPSSAGKIMDGSTSVETELLTRNTMESIDFAEGPIWLAPKFNWSHGHSTPTLVGVHGGELRDTFFEPEPENYKITWIVRNEDFHALRWGVPSFVREHIRQNGAANYVGGYIIGSETYIPALDYFTALEGAVGWDYAFERQWLYYRLWGRLLYSIDTPDTVFTAEFVRRYGKSGKNLLEAYELASKVPLRLASLFNSTWDHTLYSEGMMWLNGPSMDYIGADDLIAHEVLDPVYMSVADYVQGRLSGQPFDNNRITPPILASQLEADSQAALELVKHIETAGNPALIYEVADVKTWAHLGMHLAKKLRGATALQTYRLTGEADKQREAVEHLTEALGHWDDVVTITRPLYNDMLLTHMIGKSSNLQPDAPFHWALLRHQVAADVEMAKKADSL